MADAEVSFDSPFGDGPLDPTSPEAPTMEPGSTPQSEPDPQAQALLDSQERERDANDRAERTQRMLERTLSTPAPAPQTTPAPPSAAPMPDPVSDAEGFKSWMANSQAQAASVHRSEVDRLRQEHAALSETRSADQLFGDYISNRPGLRDKRGLVDSAAREAGVTLDDAADVIFRKTDEKLKSWGVSMGERQPLPSKSDAAKKASVGRGSAEPAGTPKPTDNNVEVDFVDQIADRAHDMGLH